MKSYLKYVLLSALICVFISGAHATSVMCAHKLNSSLTTREEFNMPFTMGEKSRIRRLLVITAMEVEEQAVLKVLPIFDEIQISEALKIRAKIFRDENKELVLVNSGIGLVNAGVVTALVTDRLKIDGILLLGVAGALKNHLKIGEIVLAHTILQHDSFYSGESETLQMAPGAPFVSVEPEQRQNPKFPTDPSFRKWLKSVMRDRIIEGTVLSGSEFVGSPDRKKALGQLEAGSLAVEMEGAGVALVAKRLSIPLAVVKTVADRLNPDNTIYCDYNQFIQSACGNAAEVVDLIWSQWSGD